MQVSGSCGGEGNDERRRMQLMDKDKLSRLKEASAPRLNSAFTPAQP
jgi:hypothetical protein